MCLDTVQSDNAHRGTAQCRREGEVDVTQGVYRAGGLRPSRR
jgi:hypothetical protein